MTQNFQKFARFDEVAMKCPNSGLIKYGMVVDTNVNNLESESNEEDVLKQRLKVWWHPKGPEEIVLRNKVIIYIYLFIRLLFKRFSKPCVIIFMFSLC